MKTALSHILPVWEACEILGEGMVHRIVSSFVYLRRGGAKRTEEEKRKLEDEIDQLTKSLMYRHPPANYPDAPMPPTVFSGWKAWASTPSLQMDKSTLLAWLVPAAARPYSGASGHQGLFDCWVYALQSHHGASGGGGAASSVPPSRTNVQVPDVLIFLAICRRYMQYRIAHPETTKEGVPTAHGLEEMVLDGDAGSGEDRAEAKEVAAMSRLTFRLYDSYQKKSVVARDTIHRFWTDVYGEALLQEYQGILTTLYHGDKSPQAVVGEADFCRRVDAHGLYVVLDWLGRLASGFAPPSPSLPLSTNAYLDTILAQMKPPLPLCDMYALAENRLYEIKRRFHSLTLSSKSADVIQGDPMSEESDVTSSPPEPASPSAHASSSSSSHAHYRPYQAITESAFCKAVSSPNADMGHGGYLPRSLAQLLFRVIGYPDPAAPPPASPASKSMSPSTTPSQASNGERSQHLWSLYQVLQFGCTAVRSNVVKSEEGKNRAILRLLFQMFQRSSSDGPEADDGDGDGDEMVLSRAQVCNMLLLLNEFADFRRTADSPVGDDESSEFPSVLMNHDVLEETLMEEESCIALGLKPPTDKPSTSPQGGYYKLSELVDYALEGTVTPNQMTFDEFCQWEAAQTAGGPPSRCGFLMLELRLVAAVLFGVPPTDATMEVMLIGEIEGRHKERYPQSDVSRRGPRGTVWYLIDSEWLKQWATMVRRVAKTPQNSDDSRGAGKDDDDGTKVRGLPRINNRGLLADDKSLNLRPDIRWKTDYEILPPLGWSALQAWYDGGPPIYRAVVRYVTSQPASPHASVTNNKRTSRIPTENELELFPFFVTVYLCDAASRGEARPFLQNFQLSRVSPIIVMLVQLCRELDVDPESARLWVMESNPDAPPPPSGSSPSKHEPEDWILSHDQNIIEQRKRRASSASDQGRGITLLLELKDKETGKWPRGIDGKEWSFATKSQIAEKRSDLGDGVVGLYNMGNTCYLNSSVQCISHTPILREYFTSKTYLRDINKANPMGHGGQLAQVSAVLINSLWKRFNQHTPHPTNRIKAPGSYAMVQAPSLTPKTFKESLGRFSEHFAGNEQHDAQELLAFLLDGLSEDLNRIVDKPYIEQPDSDGRPDSELAEIWWSNHLKREMSIVVALFTGQYKSLLTCRTCGYESARFEPFTFLQLPLPEDDYLSVSLVLYPLKDGADTLKYCVRVKADGKLRDVLAALAKVTHADEAGEDQHTRMEGDTTSEEFFSQRALNYAVVDLRDGYISKIAPNSWALVDLQSKETGELPLLHVFELEPLPDDGSSQAPLVADDVIDEAKGDDDPKAANKAKRGFLAVAQRRSDVSSQDFLHPFTHRVFGTPLLLRVDGLETKTGSELYDLIARRLRNFVPKAAQRFLVSSGDKSRIVPVNGVAKEPRKSESGADADDSTSSDAEDATPAAALGRSAHRTTTDAEDVSAGPVPRYGFRIRMTCRDGRRCLSCPWYDCCIGCLVPDDDRQTAVMDGDSLVVDWHFAVDLATYGFGTRSNPNDPGGQPFSPAPSSASPRPRPHTVPIRNHASCGAAGVKKPGFGGAITLEDCLDAFAKEEKMPETYCSKCKDFRVQTKQMSLWRLPPIVIVHLKRFQFTQQMRRKLRDLVIFPTEGLDLSRIMAPDSTATKTSTGTTGESSTPPDAGDDETDDSRENGDDASTENSNGGDSSSRSLKDSGRDEILYDLYAVVHHQGALSGGHYVASLKSEVDGQWRLFNDAQVYEIHARDVVDASAYILFYIRRDVARAKLSDYWSVLEDTDAGATEEDLENLMNAKSDRCVIS